MTARQPTTDDEIVSARHFTDPYDAMSDHEFDLYVARLFDEPSGPTRSITIRLPETLLLRLKHIASERHVPYQRLMKRILEESVSGLERRNTSRERKQNDATQRRRADV